MGYILCDWHEVYVILHELRIKSGLLKKKVLLTLVVRRHNIRSQRTSCTANISKKTKIFYLPAKISAHLPINLMWFHNFFQTAVIIKAYIQHFRFRRLNALQTVANIIMIGQFYEFFDLFYFWRDFANYQFWCTSSEFLV